MPKASAKEVWGHPQNSQPVRDWHIDYTGHPTLRQHSKYALVCVDTASALIQASPCCHANQATTAKGPKKLSTTYRYPCGTVIRSHSSKVMICKTGQKNTALNGGFISPITHKQRD